MNKKLYIILLAAVAGAITLVAYKKKSNKALYTIGVLQTASHPALDDTYTGFKQELETLTNNNVDFVFYNAQGSIPNLYSIAQKLSSTKHDAFFAIATPAAQALQAAEKNRPIAIAAVTDPVALGFVHPGSMICGTNDMIDIPGEIEMMLTLLPDTKSVSLMYTSGETNSIVAAKEMRTELEKRNITVTEFTINSETEVATITESAARKSDVLLVPTDNLIVSSMPLVSKIAMQFKKPVIASDNPSVTRGALAARGVDYKECGKQSAAILYKILSQKVSPDSFTIDKVEGNATHINQEVLQELSLTIPESLKDSVILISSKGY